MIYDLRTHWLMHMDDLEKIRQKQRIRKYHQDIEPFTRYMKMKLHKFSTKLNSKAFNCLLYNGIDHFGR